MGSLVIVKRDCGLSDVRWGCTADTSLDTQDEKTRPIQILAHIRTTRHRQSLSSDPIYARTSICTYLHPPTLRLEMIAIVPRIMPLCELQDTPRSQKDPPVNISRSSLGVHTRGTEEVRKIPWIVTWNVCNGWRGHQRYNEPNRPRKYVAIDGPPAFRKSIRRLVYLP